MHPIKAIRARLRSHLADRFDLPEIPRALVRLKQQGFTPDTVFDVGAYNGEFAEACLGLWPNAAVTCFEPLPHVQDQLRSLASRGVTILQTLVGASVFPDVKLYTRETASSVLTERANPKPDFIVCPQTTIDQTAAESRSPDFIKIDTQGYELEVLKGAEQSLRLCRAVLAEINLIDIHNDVPLIADVVRWLNDRNFVAFDICELHRRPLDKALWQADFIFVPRDSILRQDKRWDHQ